LVFELSSESAFRIRLDDLTRRNDANLVKQVAFSKLLKETEESKLHLEKLATKHADELANAINDREEWRKKFLRSEAQLAVAEKKLTFPPPPVTQPTVKFMSPLTPSVAASPKINERRSIPKTTFVASQPVAELDLLTITPKRKVAPQRKPPAPKKPRPAKAALNVVDPTRIVSCCQGQPSGLMLPCTNCLRTFHVSCLPDNALFAEKFECRFCTSSV